MVVGRKFLRATRRGKNVLIHLQGGKTILVHMKMTGHLLYGEYRESKVESLPESLREPLRAGPKSKIGEKKRTIWEPIKPKALKDPYNRFVHLVFSLSNGQSLVLSDARKFAKIILLKGRRRDDEFCNTGPEPLAKNFSYDAFVKTLDTKPKGKIKTVLMDQNVIAGIGNIYSDEILWASSVHPERRVDRLSLKEKKDIFKNIKVILEKSIKLGGDSMSDYRNPYGEKGKFQNFHKVYRRAGQKCAKSGCAGIIKRIIVGGRSAHFCPTHQI